MPTLPSSSSMKFISPSSTQSGLETSGLSPSASLQERRDWLIHNSTSFTDWARVFAEADSDAPIAYNAEDDDDMYDPNDDAAVEAAWLEAAREGHATRGIGKDAVVLTPEDLGFNK